MTSGRVLILGASSLLARYLVLTRTYSMHVHGTWYTNPILDGNLDSVSRVDITDKNALAYVMQRLRPTLVINTAAIGDVDYCDAAYNHAYAVNVTGVGNVLAACKAVGAKLVHISSNAVFSGNCAPYDEQSDREPVNRYGAMKKLAENTVMADYRNWIIIRPILLYGVPHVGGRGNWVTKLRSHKRDDGAVSVVDDTVTQPTYAADCANSIWKLIDMDAVGVYHIGGASKVSLFEFAAEICRVFELDVILRHAKSTDFPGIAPRPVDTTYDLNKLRDAIKDDYMPRGIEAGLEAMKRGI